MTDQSNTSNDKQLSVQDIIREIEQKSEGGGYIYRGERERHEGEPYYGKVSSSLWREYRIENEHFDVELVQKELLTAAKKHTGDLPEDFRLDIIDALRTDEKSAEEAVDFEILTEIQHYGGKTNLIDFTTDYFIALFFACDGQLNQDGRVILQKIDAIRDMIQHPRNPQHRVTAQKSVFIRPPRGFIEPRKDEIVIVPAYLKAEILEHLRTYHGISTEVIYNDLHGFIRNQDIHGEAYTAFYKGLACQNKADAVKTSEEREQEYEKAIAHYTKAIGLKPDLAEAYTNRGVAYGQKGDIDAALRDYDKAIELNAQDADVYTNRGVAYGKKGDIDAALQDFNKVIDLNPQYPNAYYNRGVAYGQKGDVDAALQDYSKAIALKPDFAEPYYNRGNVYDNKGDVDAAIQDYTKFIALNPQYAEAYYNRGITYGKKGDIDAALQNFSKAIELNPQYAEAYGNRGIAYGLTGHVDAALQDYSKAIALKPDFAEVYINRSVMWLYLREWEKAKADLSDVKRMGADISTLFHRNYGSVEGFEQRTRIQLPADLVALLTPQ